ncbi:hypothetical protein SO802_021355 [Lithocarpus litseifolius]|uniref:Uncharacterized protein n=1 Tax=Lithocarpus litseifolius TaxID=425828 RepID=A0AAW2CEL4_9ROSI
MAESFNQRFHRRTICLPVSLQLNGNHLLQIQLQLIHSNLSIKIGKFYGTLFAYTDARDEVLTTSCERVKKEMNSLCIAASVMCLTLLYCQGTGFSKIIVELNVILLSLLIF